MWSTVVYSIKFGAVKENHDKANQDGQYVGRVLSPVPPEYEARVLSTQSYCLVKKKNRNGRLIMRKEGEGA
jgi:hypothetical protein